LIEGQLSLKTSFLDQQCLARLLGQQRTPQQVVVLPPRIVGCEIDKLFPEGGRKAVLDAAFVLTHGDELLRAGGADGLPHGPHPARENILREQKVVVILQGIPSYVHASRCEFNFFWKRKNSYYRCGG